MVNLELRRQVAEARGWKHVKLHRSRPYEFEGFLIEPMGTAEIGPLTVPAFESDIAPAWGLMSEMCGSDPVQICLDWDGKEWACVNVDIAGSAWVYGNAIHPQVAAEFIAAYMESSQ